MDDTLVIQWTIIGVGGGLAVLVVAAAWAVVRLIKAELRAEISELRAEMNTNDSSLRVDMNANDAQLRADMAQLRVDMNANDAQLRADMNANDAQLRADMNAHVSRLETAISGLQQQIVAIRQMLARFALHRHGDDGLPLAPLTDSLDPPEGNASNGEGNG